MTNFVNTVATNVFGTNVFVSYSVGSIHINDTVIGIGVVVAFIFLFFLIRKWKINPN